MNADELLVERQRFATVMKARRDDKELIELFHKLVLSDKFAEGAKPYCYADLVVESARRISDNNLALLMQTLEERSVARKIRGVVPAADAEVAMRAVIKRVFTTTPRKAEPLLNAFLWSERAGVGIDRAHTICLGLEGGINMDVMDEICDLTIYLYYPSMPRWREPEPELLAA